MLCPQAFGSPWARALLDPLLGPLLGTSFGMLLGRLLGRHLLSRTFIHISSENLTFLCLVMCLGTAPGAPLARRFGFLVGAGGNSLVGRVLPGSTAFRPPSVRVR